MCLKSSYFNDNTVQTKVCDGLVLLCAYFCDRSEHSNITVVVLDQVKGSCSHYVVPKADGWENLSKGQEYLLLPLSNVSFSRHLQIGDFLSYM